MLLYVLDGVSDILTVAGYWSRRTSTVLQGDNAEVSQHTCQSVVHL